MKRKADPTQELIERMALNETALKLALEEIRRQDSIIMGIRRVLMNHEPRGENSAGYDLWSDVYAELQEGD